MVHSRLLDYEAGVDSHTGNPVVPSLQAMLKIAKGYDLDFTDLLVRAGYAIPGAESAEDERALMVCFRDLAPNERQELLHYANELARRTPH
ncbi:MAG TPA: hypothetical protein V6D47_14095 [Oscillatoriaceae cyanobacterium]